MLGRIVYNDKDQEIFNFGKHKGTTVEEVLRKEPGYYGWMLNGDFPLYTKKVLTKIKGSMNAKKSISTLEDLQNKFNNKI